MSRYIQSVYRLCKNFFVASSGEQPNPNLSTCHSVLEGIQENLVLESYPDSSMLFFSLANGAKLDKLRTIRGRVQANALFM